MMRSMFSGVSGLRNHQIRMDVIGNNIANVNTIGFKGSRVNFQDILSQTMQGAAAPQGNRGGTNPMQVGLGMAVASIDTVFTDGSTQNTGKQTDLALQGQGFFIVNDGSKSYYTRAGNFDFDTAGNYIVPSTGLKVQGWNANNAGTINTNAPTGNIQIPIGISMAASPTANTTYSKNLNSAETEPVQTSTTVYDSLGQAHIIDIKYFKPTADVNVTGAVLDDAAAGNSHTETFSVVDNNGNTRNLSVIINTTTSGTPGPADWTIDVQESGASLTGFPKAGQLLADFDAGFAVDDGGTLTMNLAYPGVTSGTYNTGTEDIVTTPNAWNWSASTNDSTVVIAAGGSSNAMTFSGTGQYTTGNGSLTLNFTNGANNNQVIVADMSGMTQYASESTVAGTSDGYASGALQTVTIDTSGIVSGVFSNGRNQALAQVALANFNNASGLMKAAQNTYEQSNNSGVAQVGAANTGGLAKIAPGTLEMSNVDLSQEFTNMIVTQRGFQANSKIITTSDEMLQDLVNLKR